ncbi:vWA domain-containing protein [Salinicoccus carnicancri]|uniref:vWA domain-containing protein n=1 Tax=Salinicoccus carnicancri TaxID=558170 RepID=UPI0002DBC114|nr:VWA domain-containing protein [Salinicoccus carnicancri]
MRVFLLMGLFMILTACSTTEENSDESNEKVGNTGESTEDESAEAEASSEENETTEESTASNESENIEMEISLESVLEEEEGTMIDASRQEIEDELTAFIEENDGDVTDEMVYEKLLEMLGGHPDMQEGIKYFQDFSAELVDLTDQPGGLKVEDGELSLRNNVYILMDKSGSMADEIDGKTKMDAAKESVNQFVEDMPNGTQVSLINYGFSKDNNGEDDSCSAVEETFPIGEYEENEFNEALNQYGSEGFTPLALAIEEVGKVIKNSESTGSHTIYVVSDGQETCNGDPVAAVQDLPEDESIETVLNIIGFDIQDDEVQSLVDVTEANGGEYLSATNPDELSEILKREKLNLFIKYRDWSNENLKNITQASNNKHLDRTQVVNAANTANRQTDNSMNGVLNDVSFSSSQEFRYPKAREWSEERYLIIRDFLSENYEVAGDDIDSEKEKLRDSVNQEFDEIERDYKEDIEE